MNYCILLAGGKGTRFGNDLPKQFFTVYEKPIIIYTLQELSKNLDIDKIIVGCIKEYITYLNNLIVQYNLIDKISVIEGGKDGLDTVHKALKKISNDAADNDIIIIYEAVRPLVNNKTISKTIKMSTELGNAVVVKRVYESPLYSDNLKNSSYYLEREKICLLMQPQTFKFGIIKNLYNNLEKYNSTKITCTGILAVEAGISINYIYDDFDNFKITTRDDLVKFKYYLKLRDEIIKN